MERARGLGNEGRIDEALALLDEGGAVFLTNATVQALRGTLLEAQGRTDHAAEAFRRAVLLKPTPQVCLSFGLTLEKLGLFSDAAEAFRKASVAMGGENESLHRSTALARLNQLERRKQK
jgi:tetratricopeptide (TPR) repeat protein